MTYIEQKLGKKYFGAWKASKGLKKAEVVEKAEEEHTTEEESTEPKVCLCLTQDPWAVDGLPGNGWVA